MNSFEMTRRFHVAMGLPANDRPIEPTPNERIFRAKLLLEETLETIEKGLGLRLTWNDGVEDINIDSAGIGVVYEGKPYDPVETLDGLADVKTVANGTAVQFGLPQDVADRLVFESNMSKLDENGKPVVNRCGRDDCADAEAGYCERPDHLVDPTQPVGKVLKSSRYKKVDLESVLRAMWPEREWG